MRDSNAMVESPKPMPMTLRVQAAALHWGHTFDFVKRNAARFLAGCFGSHNLHNMYVLRHDLGYTHPSNNSAHTI